MQRLSRSRATKPSGRPSRIALIRPFTRVSHGTGPASLRVGGLLLVVALHRERDVRRWRCCGLRAAGERPPLHRTLPVDRPPLLIAVPARAGLLPGYRRIHWVRRVGRQDAGERRNDPPEEWSDGNARESGNAPDPRSVHL